jgi:hypothetical protein
MKSASFAAGSRHSHRTPDTHHSYRERWSKLPVALVAVCQGSLSLFPPLFRRSPCFCVGCSRVSFRFRFPLFYLFVEFLFVLWVSAFCAHMFDDVDNERLVIELLCAFYRPYSTHTELSHSNYCLCPPFRLSSIINCHDRERQSSGRQGEADEPRQAARRHAPCLGQAYHERPGSLGAIAIAGC